jgi:hypothetical protein
MADMSISLKESKQVLLYNDIQQNMREGVGACYFGTYNLTRCGKQMEKLPHYNFSWTVSPKLDLVWKRLWTCRETDKQKKNLTTVELHFHSPICLYGMVLN